MSIRITSCLLKFFHTACFLLLFASLPVLVSAQVHTYKVTGTVIDSLTQQPVDYATIAIYHQGAASPFSGATTNQKGVFTISGLDAGVYKLTIDFLGYRHLVINPVVVMNKPSVLSLGNVLLVPQATLKEVTVTASGPVVENNIDKMVYNASNDITTQGGVALDVLKKVPQVSVDIDGNVELQGNSNIRFLINGKPSSIFGTSLTDALQSIPASQIKSIEVITSPGARYDASGTGGIINIILKENKAEGLNGSINFSAGTRLENGSVNLSMHEKHFSVGMFFSGNKQLSLETIAANNRQSYNTLRDTTTNLIQNSNSNFERGGYQTGLNLQWDLSAKDNIAASINYSHFDNSNIDNIIQQQQVIDRDNDILSSFSGYNNSDTHFNSQSVDCSLDYRRDFKRKGQQLDVLYTSSYGTNATYFTQQQGYDNGLVLGQHSNNPGHDYETDISVDYVQPLSKKVALSLGGKAVIENFNNSVITDTLQSNNYVYSPTQSYSFSYNRNIYAAYASASFSVLDDFITGVAGIRDEYATASSDYQNANVPDYNVVAPSVVLQHKIDKGQSIKLSYTYRIKRPDYSDLNPFYNISDPHSITTGNPTLQPEIAHNFELGYNKLFKDGINIYTAAFYKYDHNDLQTFTLYYDSLLIGNVPYYNVFLNQRFNIGTETTTGLSFFGSASVSNFSFRTNVLVGDRITTNPGLPTTSGLMCRINANVSYQFPHNIAIEAFGNYRSSEQNIQGIRPSFLYYNIALRKQFWNKKAGVGITAVNPFNKYITQRSNISGTGFTQSTYKQIAFRSFGLTLTYKFGKKDFGKPKQEQQNTQLQIPGQDD